MTPILTASVDAWPSRGPRVPTGAQELCPVIQQWIRASELGKMLGSMRGSPHGKGEQVQKWGWAREKVWDFIFLLDATELEIRWGRFGFLGAQLPGMGQAHPPIPADHAAPLPAAASLCRERGLGGHHGVSVVFSACSRARKEQGPLQGSFGMRGVTWVWDISRDRGVVERHAHTEGWMGSGKRPFLCRHTLPAVPWPLPIKAADMALSPPLQRTTGQLQPQDVGQCEEFHVSIWNLLHAVVVASL